MFLEMVAANLGPWNLFPDPFVSSNGSSTVDCRSLEVDLKEHRNPEKSKTEPIALDFGALKIDVLHKIQTFLTQLYQLDPHNVGHDDKEKKCHARYGVLNLGESRVYPHLETPLLN